MHRRDDMLAVGGQNAKHRMVRNKMKPFVAQVEPTRPTSCVGPFVRPPSRGGSSAKVGRGRI